MGPLRSLLYIPGNRPSMLEKARPLPTDILVPDLEDSVPPTEKGAARALVKSLLPGFALKGQRVFVRVNPLSSGLTEEDLKEVIGEGLDGVHLPKVESAAEVEEVDRRLNVLERERGLEQGRVRLIAEVETAKGIARANEIASASSRLIGLAFGAEDFTRDMGIERSKEGMQLLYPRSAVAIAARVGEITALDTPYADFRDEAGLFQEARLARLLGFGGKYLIHPSQIEPVNQVFRPSSEEIAQARKIVESFEQAQAQGSAATSLDGKMVDTPIAERARKLLALAETIGRKTI